MTYSQVKNGVYNCPNCGAAATPESVRCAYCHSSLATLICSKCYGAIFIGMNHCPWCGTNASVGKALEDAKRKCPRCNTSLLLVKVTKRLLNECPACGGIWVDKDTLQEICTDQEQQQAVMGFDPEPAPAAGAGAPLSGRTYIPCPECNNLMNRRQFADCSGVIVDWCKTHGTWFDRNELRQIVQFIQSGGLERSRERERFKLKEEKQHLQEERHNLDTLSRLGRDTDSVSARNSTDMDLFSILAGIWHCLK